MSALGCKMHAVSNAVVRGFGGSQGVMVIERILDDIAPTLGPFARDEMGAQQIARLVCPIGIAGIASKWPGAIAVAIAAQLLQGLESTHAKTPALNDLTTERTPMPESGCAASDCAGCAQTVRRIVGPGA